MVYGLPPTLSVARLPKEFLAFIGIRLSVRPRMGRCEGNRRSHWRGSRAVRQADGESNTVERWNGGTVEQWNGGTVERLRSVRIGGRHIGQLDFLGYCSQFMQRPSPLETRRPADHPTIRQRMSTSSDLVELTTRLMSIDSTSG